MRPLSPITFLLKPIIKLDQRQKREAVERGIPKVRLGARHMERCQLLLDRAALLRCLPTGGVCAEVGVDEGDFSEAILRTVQPRELHLVDTWASRRYSEAKFDAVRKRFAAPIADGTVRIHRQRSLEAVSSFADGLLDWVYIDTTHSYELTARELRAYAPKLRAGGLLAGHDYSMGNWERAMRYGVIEAVHEFCVQEGWSFAYLTMEPTERQSFAIRRLDAPAGA